ncbi:MAG: putative ABC exporter domain-containing protein [Planctomycetota bacterium]
MLVHSALHLLVRLKIRASVRQQLLRMKRPSGWIFAILGGVLILAWLSALLFSDRVAWWRGSASVAKDPLIIPQAGGLLFALMTIIGAFNHRGLYLPKEEIERLFSAPIRRTDLVRYRLLVNFLRSLFAGILFGALYARRTPVWFFGFSGVLVAMLSLPILGQATALLLGDAENRLARLARRLPLRGISFVLAIVLVAAIGVIATGALSDVHIDRWLRRAIGIGVDADSLASEPLVRLLLLPFKPWAAMIMAADAATFWAWFCVCVGIAVIGFELCARIPVDFRELSLATSADVARRLNRIRTGGMGAAGGEISRRALGWNLPWLFGRGAFGAIAWLKLTAIARKARGALLVSATIVALVTFVITTMFSEPTREAAIFGALVLAGMGTIYLCTGLRFDFRQDLEQMERIKAWPTSPVLIFFANILPEVMLVSGVLALAVLGRALVTDQFHVELLAIVAWQPLATLAWVALDNAVFLYAPVKYTPGQEGALQHMGRSLVLMLLRMLLLLVVLALAGGPAVGTYFGVRALSGDETLSTWLALAVGWCVLLAIDAGLLFFGGAMLRRFDVARDRG